MPTSPHVRRRIVRLWLLAVAALVLATVLIGGTTRLTRSGLAIVEWKPVTGILPPLSQREWQAEFQKYQTIPQYRELNRGMSLSDFKTIYWWEWTHRLLGRLIGAVFLLPFLFFLWRGWIEPRWRAPLWVIFGLGALQGAVGWWMVASGLSERVSVSQYWLAFHLTLGCLIYAALLWTAQRLVPRPVTDAPARLRASAAALLILVLVQIYLGALVAGLDAGLTYNTWPLIDGAFVPSAARLWFLEPAWRNIFENALTAQFNHRMAAYALFIGALLHAIDAARGARGWLASSAVILALAITLQAGIGIVTLLHHAALPLALLHQAMAMVVLTIAIVHAERLMKRRAMPARGAAAAPPSPITPQALARDRQ